MKPQREAKEEAGLGLDLIVEVRRLVQAAKTRSKSGCADTLMT